MQFVVKWFGAGFGGGELTDFCADPAFAPLELRRAGTARGVISRLCIGANGCGRRPQAVEPGGGEIPGETEFLEQRGLGGGDFGRQGITVEIAE